MFERSRSALPRHDRNKTCICIYIHVIREGKYESTIDTCVVEDDGTDGRDCGQRKPPEVERNRVIIKRRNREIREEDSGGQRKRRGPFQK